MGSGKTVTNGVVNPYALLDTGILYLVLKAYLWFKLLFFIFFGDDYYSTKKDNVVKNYLNEVLMRYRPREETLKSKKVVVNVTAADHQFLKVMAADNGITMTQFVIRALHHYLKEVFNEDREIKTP